MAAFSLSVSAVKSAKPPAAGQRDQVLQKQHADATVMQVGC
jgi:hypothetical protein